MIVPAGGYVVIAFQADNPGYWFMHCHMEVHQLEGMAVIIQEYPESEHKKPPYGINDVGNFFWPTEPKKNKESKESKESKGSEKAWKITGIVFIVAFVVITVIFVASIVAVLVLGYS